MTCPWDGCGAPLAGIGTFCHACKRYAGDAPPRGAAPAEVPGGDGEVGVRQVLTLPLPPSVNAMWRTVARLKGVSALSRATSGGDVAAVRRAASGVSAFSTMLLSREGREYKKTADAWLAAQRPKMVSGPVSLRAVFYFPRRSGDVDNRLKPLLDVLEGRIYENDRQVAHVAAWKRVDRDRPRVVLSVEPGEGPPDPFHESGDAFSFDLDF